MKVNWRQATKEGSMRKLIVSTVTVYGLLGFGWFAWHWWNVPPPAAPIAPKVGDAASYEYPIIGMDKNGCVFIVTNSTHIEGHGFKVGDIIRLEKHGLAPCTVTWQHQYGRVK